MCVVDLGMVVNVIGKIVIIVILMSFGNLNVVGIVIYGIIFVIDIVWVFIILLKYIDKLLND